MLRIVPVANANIPQDNELPSGWLDGSVEVSAANVRSALVRAHLYLGGYSTGIYDFETFGIHKTSSPSPVKVINAWKEDGREKTFEHEIPAGMGTAEF